MSKFHLRIAGVQDTDIVCAKITALCAFHDDQAKLDPAFFTKSWMILKRNCVSYWPRIADRLLD